MSKKVIATDKAPGAIGPYSQGVDAGCLIYTSGQLPINMATGELETANVKEAAKHSLDNLKAILEAAGSSMDKVIKTTVFLTNLADFADVNEVYAGYFGSNPPARSCVQVSALPKGATVEIEAIALP